MKFRRQHPYDRFVLDFFCVEQQLVVEVDGGIHEIPEQKMYDQERTLLLTDKGIRVLRFSNDEIFAHLETVLKEIIAYVQDHPVKPPPLLERRFCVQERGPGGEVRPGGEVEPGGDVEQGGEA